MLSPPAVGATSHQLHLVVAILKLDSALPRWGQLDEVAIRRRKLSLGPRAMTPGTPRFALLQLGLDTSNRSTELNHARDGDTLRAKQAMVWVDGSRIRIAAVDAT